MINIAKTQGDNFCLAPWVNLHVSLEGKMKPCCGGDGDFGTIQQGDWSYIKGTNRKAIMLRQELVEGKKPEYCNKCQERDWYKRFKQQDILVNDINDFQLLSIDARWGTTCQLTCTYCNSANSTAWAALNQRVDRIAPDPAFAFRDQKAELFEFIEQHIHTIRRVNLVGGEPLLLKDNVRLLDMLGDDVEIEVITNLDVDLDNNEVYQRLIERDNVSWNLSMENIGERFEFVRRGAQWDQHVKNMRQLERDTAKSSRVALKIHSLYNVYSALRLTELYDFCEQELDRFTINCESFVHDPAPLSFLRAPDELKYRSLEQIQHCHDRASGRFVHERGIWLWLHDRVSASLGTGSPDLIAECVAFHAEQEARYFNNRFDFLSLWPEYR